MTMMFQQWRSYLSFHVLWMKHINLMFSVSFICRQILIKLQLRLSNLFNFFFKKLCLSILEKTIIRYNTVSDFNKVKSYSFWRKNEQFVSFYNQLLGNSCNYLTFNWFQLNSMIRKPMNSMVLYTENLHVFYSRFPWSIGLMGSRVDRKLMASKDE